jgi:hypothetical protein
MRLLVTVLLMASFFLRPHLFRKHRAIPRSSGAEDRNKLDDASEEENWNIHVRCSRFPGQIGRWQFPFTPIPKKPEREGPRR